MCKLVRVGLLGAVLLGAVLVPAALAAERDGETSLGTQQRLERIQALQKQRARPQTAPNPSGRQGSEALRSSTVGGRPSPQVIPNATDVSLDIDGDFDLGGFVFKDGVPFLHNEGGVAYGNTALGLNALVSQVQAFPYGAYNTAVGQDAGRYNVSGISNAGIGTNALRANTGGHFNTAAGTFALYMNTTGDRNAALGISAMYGNTVGRANTATGGLAMANFSASYGDGSYNTANGYRSLFYNDTGNMNTAVGAYALAATTSTSYNTAVGFSALYANTGVINTAIGFNAGLNWTTGIDNIAVGSGAYGVAGETGTIRIGGNYQSKAFIGGVRGATTYVADAIPVLIDSAGQLGTVSSSAAVKEDIQDLGGRSDRLLDLRPVAFRYKEPFKGGVKPIQFGLVAEEVAEVFPELVVYNQAGEPETVRYHWLSTLLLKELQDETARAQSREAQQQAELQDLQQQVADLRKVVAELQQME